MSASCRRTSRARSVPRPTESARTVGMLDFPCRRNRLPFRFRPAPRTFETCPQRRASGGGSRGWAWRAAASAGGSSPRRTSSSTSTAGAGRCAGRASTRRSRTTGPANADRAPRAGLPQGDAAPIAVGDRPAEQVPAAALGRRLLRPARSEEPASTAPQCARPARAAPTSARPHASRSSLGPRR